MLLTFLGTIRITDSIRTLKQIKFIAATWNSISTKMHKSALGEKLKMSINMQQRKLTFSDFFFSANKKRDKN